MSSFSILQAMFDFACSGEGLYQDAAEYTFVFPLRGLIPANSFGLLTHPNSPVTKLLFRRLHFAFWGCDSFLGDESGFTLSLVYLDDDEEDDNVVKYFISPSLDILGDQSFCHKVAKDPFDLAYLHKTLIFSHSFPFCLSCPFKKQNLPEFQGDSQPLFAFRYGPREFYSADLDFLLETVNLSLCLVFSIDDVSLFLEKLRVFFHKFLLFGLFFPIQDLFLGFFFPLFLDVSFPSFHFGGIMDVDHLE